MTGLVSKRRTRHQAVYRHVQNTARLESLLRDGTSITGDTNVLSSWYESASLAAFCSVSMVWEPISESLIATADPTCALPWVIRWAEV
jgi:hypothetical protein